MTRQIKKNEYIYYTFIHLLVESFNNYFEKVCELDIIMNVEKAYFIIEEMIQNGQILETSKNKVVEPLLLLDKSK